MNIFQVPYLWGKHSHPRNLESTNANLLLWSRVEQRLTETAGTRKVYLPSLRVQVYKCTSWRAGISQMPRSLVMMMAVRMCVCARPWPGDCTLPPLRSLLWKEQTMKFRILDSLYPEKQRILSCKTWVLAASLVLVAVPWASLSLPINGSGEDSFPRVWRWNEVQAALTHGMFALPPSCATNKALRHKLENFDALWRVMFFFF